MAGWLWRPLHLNGLAPAASSCHRGARRLASAKAAGLPFKALKARDIHCHIADLDLLNPLPSAPPAWTFGTGRDSGTGLILGWSYGGDSLPHYSEREIGTTTFLKSILSSLSQSLRSLALQPGTRQTPYPCPTSTGQGVPPSRRVVRAGVGGVSGGDLQH